MRKLSRKLALSVVVSAAFLLPAYGQQNSPRKQPPLDIPATIKAFKAVMVIDQSMVAKGTAPPEILRYDDQILALLNGASDIWAKQDKARANEFVARLNSLRAAKDEAQKPYEAAARARADEAGRGLDATRNALGTGPRPTGPHPCPAGPGPGEVQVGTGEGGEPFCQ